MGAGNRARDRRAGDDRRDRAVRRLFGTVWGIMNSFIGISKSHTTNLAVVAPGIAEAAACDRIRPRRRRIPAVVIYNVFARSTSRLRGAAGDTTAVAAARQPDLDRRARASNSDGGPMMRATAGDHRMSVRLDHGKNELDEVHESTSRHSST